MSDEVNNPKHYDHPSGIQPIEITQFESFLRGNIIKYVMRAPYKNNELQDLKKAEFYLRMEIERVIEQDAEEAWQLEQSWSQRMAERRAEDLQNMRNEWDEDYYDYYRAGMTGSPDFCEECYDNCKVCDSKEEALPSTIREKPEKW